MTANKVRTSLTMLGIIIGISSVIVMVAIGQARKVPSSPASSRSAPTLIVFPGAQRSFGYGASAGRGGAQTLTPADATAIETQISNIAAVSPEVSGRYQVTAKGTNTNTTVNGVSAAYADVHNIQVNDGSFITDANGTNLAHVAVIGPTTVSDLFATGTEPVGQTIAAIRKI